MSHLAILADQKPKRNRECQLRARNARDSLARVKLSFLTLAIAAANVAVDLGRVGAAHAFDVPFELATEVFLDRGHQPPHVVDEVELAGILGRHDLCLCR